MTWGDFQKTPSMPLPWGFHMGLPQELEGLVAPLQSLMELTTLTLSAPPLVLSGHTPLMADPNPGPSKRGGFWEM